MRPAIVPPHKTFGTIVGLLTLLTSALPGLAQQNLSQKSPAAPSALQQRPAPQPAPDGDLLTYFYKDPRPERLTGFLARFQDTPIAERPQAFPALSGFFAAICIAHPGRFPGMVPADLKPKTAAAISAAVRLCGNERVAAALKQTLDRSPPDEQIKAIIASLPRLSDLRVTHPMHLDILWSASFATANPAYVRTIYLFYLGAAGLPGVDARDIVTIVLLRLQPNKPALDAITAKYSREMLLTVIYAASALWSLDSNARQHPFVANALSVYQKEAPESLAVQGLVQVRKAIDDARASQRR